ncbi:MAG TPA: nucleoside triphosphate pyrophosphohydrolase [Catalimonadaceae bacterium]|nr:nucleoside triphosphate pyrophosphohydrolase [Catalimonadaceae bacterium]HPI10593.1 nucleoside triphosphate pyrophosphohydrolase [Catalimonadaceae bacterium]
MIPAPPDPERKRKLDAFDRLLTVMDELRLNCPWDKKQTHESLRHLTIEEVYELGDAILSGEQENIKKELGDVLLHIVFYSRIASETNDFNIADVIDAVCEKLIFRHPHIYSNVTAETEEDVKRNWESLKKKEGQELTLSGVPRSLPPMVKAMRIQEKARGAGFDWDEPAQVWEKVLEEIQEFREITVDGKVDAVEAEKELGDVFFSLINYARFLKLNPDQALERTNLKFIIRFNYLEEKARSNGKSLNDMTLQEMDVYWNEAKLLV